MKTLAGLKMGAIKPENMHFENINLKNGDSNGFKQVKPHF